MDLNVFLMICMFASSVNSQIQFKPISNDTHCNNETVEYQCSVSNAIFTWTVLQSNEIQFGIDATYNLNSNAQPVPIENIFVPERISAVSAQLPIISNITFTVQPSINGYTIQCVDGVTLEKKNVTITVITPTSPGNVTIEDDTFTSTTVTVSWMQSPSVCDTTFNYTVNTTNTITGSTTNNSIVLSGLQQSNDVYCITVTATDYTTRTSNESCFLFNVPPAANSIMVTNVSDTNTTARVDITWEHGSYGIQSSDVTLPVLTGYHVSIENSSADVINETESLLSPDTTEYFFTGISLNATYTVRVVAVNGVGSTESNETIVIPDFIPSPSSSSSSSSTMIMSSSTFSSGTPTDTLSTNIMSSTSSLSSVTPTNTGSTSSKQSVSLIPIIAGVVGGIVILALLIVIVLIVALICYKNRSKGTSDLNELFHPKEDKNAPIPLVEKSLPETGQSLYQDPDTIEHKQAPTGDLYALPDTKSKRRAPPTQPVAEVPTYQDPNTIQRHQAPTGDIYTLPEKKPVYSKVNKKAKEEGTMYAELDLHGATPKSPSELPLVQQEVLYSDVRH